MLACSIEYDQTRTPHVAPPRHGLRVTDQIQVHVISLTSSSRTVLGWEDSRSSAGPGVVSSAWDVLFLALSTCYREVCVVTGHQTLCLRIVCFFFFLPVFYAWWGGFLCIFFSCMLGFHKKMLITPPTPKKQKTKNTQENHLSTKSHSTERPQQ